MREKGKGNGSMEERGAGQRDFRVGIEKKAKAVKGSGNERRMETKSEVSNDQEGGKKEK